jgi:hypothetical protein
MAYAVVLIISAQTCNDKPYLGHQATNTHSLLALLVVAIKTEIRLLLLWVKPALMFSQNCGINTWLLYLKVGLLYKHNYSLIKSMQTKPEGLTWKPSTSHDPKPVQSTSHYHTPCRLPCSIRYKRQAQYKQVRTGHVYVTTSRYV